MPSQPSILRLTIANKNDLFAAYMPFVENGGLFVPTDKAFKLGDEVMIMLELNEERTAIPGKVAWINPRRAQGKQVRGVGIQFNKQAEAAATRRKIEAELAGRLDADRATQTM